MSTIRDGFTLPNGVGCPCDGMFHNFTAHHTGDGWTWGAECNVCGEYWGDDASKRLVDWPFVEDVATADDWRRAGFEVV